MIANNDINTTNAPVASNGISADEIDLRELFFAIWHGKWIIFSVTFIFAVASVFYALSLPNIYKSEALLAPVSESSGMKIPGQLGGLAALAGVNLGSGGADNTALALNIIKSREFIGRFIIKHDLFVPVMAAKGWDRESDTLLLDVSVYNEETKEWVREVKPPYLPKPSVLETYEKFMRLLNVSQDKTSGMITISIDHISPYIAQRLVTSLVQDINDEMRRRDLQEAQSSIKYLTDQIEKTNVSDLRTTLFSLIEDQTKTVMLANVREEYVFKTVDPAVVAERKDKPSRALICILSVMFGGMLSIFIVLVRNFTKKS